MTRIITKALQNQYESSHKMLTDLVDRIPNHLWCDLYQEVPIWKQVYHVVFFIDFWFRDTYDDSDFKSMTFKDTITPELVDDAPEGTYITRNEMKEYLEKIHNKTIRIFELLSDIDMARPIMKGIENYTYTDVVLGQIRHIMYNVGYCNSCLRENGLPEADWYAYNEYDED